MSALTLDLPAAVLDRVRHEARRDGNTLAGWVAEAVSQRLRYRQPLTARARPVAPCPDCQHPPAPGCRGYCLRCYTRRRRKEAPNGGRPVRACVECGAVKRVYGWGRCGACYQRQRRAPLTYCRACRTYQPHAAQHLCATCYQRRQRQARRARAVAS